MSCIEYVNDLVKGQGEYIDDIDFNNLNLRDIIALISYMDAQDRIWATTSYFIKNGIAIKILRRLESLCENRPMEELLDEKKERPGMPEDRTDYRNAWGVWSNNGFFASVEQPAAIWVTTLGDKPKRDTEMPYPF